ncbi:hypothetical protein OC846_006086 [Tilletia horrida]|uniref:SRP54-type proteins GTP-binding domain-containing protein n=1 Tax=Tilletia horrida TaxID=155126 RepID=A0AAN6JNY3_9BASI|nr:hypothetical protein OC846_006086 [Tilletia horrida]KAK0547324.1 hypothetical protein OC845_004145 [Tilletia horrida]KAK0564597.1 hypothetical protein OC861_004187 [Tilletia horrida]
MLDHFTILARNGVVVWQHSFAANAGSSNNSNTTAINALISSVFLEQRTGETRFDKDSYTARWSFANDYDGLIFIAVYQRILQLTYIDQLLASVQDQFTALFGPLIKTILSPSNANAITPSLQAQFASALQSWNQIFLATLRSLERAHTHGKRNVTPSAAAASAASAAALPPPSPGGTRQGKSTDPAEIAKNVEALKARLKNTDLGGGGPGKKGKGGKGKGGGGGAGAGSDKSGTSTPGGADSPSIGGAAGGKKKGKEMRKWAEDGSAVTVSQAADLDFSTAAGDSDAVASDSVASRWVDKRSLGVKGSDGTYELADVEGDGQAGDEDEEDEAEDEEDESAGANGHQNGGSSSKGGFLSRIAAASTGTSSSLFSRLTGSSSRPLTEADLQPILDKMSSHLQSKNVATEVASQLCLSVKQGLVGRQLGTFASTKNEVRRALEGAIEQILTPKTSTDILREISAKRLAARAAAMASAAASASGPARTGAGADPSSTTTTDPYSICFVGVNGVGKSTNLAKVCFWLLQNDLRVLIAACDTFRAGAVEQLRTHVRNLGALRVGSRRVDGRNDDGSESSEGLKSNIELFEQGYGKDAAGIASLALSHARKNGFDIVLIDTAGRMQDNEPLMRALAKLVSVNKPDKIVFVGEALVGNEAVMQLRGFDRALKDFSGVSNPRGLDGMLLTKFDTIDDKVGTSLTATAVTGLPIFFVGVGQSYTDLRTLRVRHIVDALMRD